MRFKTIQEIIHLFFLTQFIAGCGVAPNAYTPPTTELPPIALGQLGPGDEPPTPSTSNYILKSSSKKPFTGVSN